MKTYWLYYIVILMLIPAITTAQHENKLIRKGNKSYEEGDYKDAEINYLKSLEKGKQTEKGLYNLGDALYMQNNYTQATAAFDSLRTLKMDDPTRADAYYNLGNSLLKLARDSAQIASQALQSSINAYKNSLRIDPSDQDAKYNLAYAQKLLNEQQQQQQNQDQQKQQQNQDQQKQQQNQDQQNQQQQDQQQQQQQKQEQSDQNEQAREQQQQQQPQEISKEDAERILEALKNDEKQTLEKLKQAQVKNVRVAKSDKDW